MGDRIIFHCDCNSFYASVEETFHPEYKSVPMAIAGDRASRRGIILAKNELAKTFHIQTAETVWSAQKKCPQLLLCPPRHHTYGEFSQRINRIYEEYTDRVERFGIDESFLDVTGSLHLFGVDGVGLAHQIRRRVSREIGVTISVGVSWNKIFAKLGSDYKKPDAVTAITRENYRDIAWPLPASDLFFVGEQIYGELRKYGIMTIGDLAAADEGFLAARFGKMGGQLRAYAAGCDDSPVALVGESEPVKSVGNSMTFRRNLLSDDDIRLGVATLAESVGWRLRKMGMKCQTVQVGIKDDKLKSITRQRGLDIPTNLTADLMDVSLGLIRSNWEIGKPIRLLSVTAQHLVREGEAPEQQNLFAGDRDMARKKNAELENALDKLREKYGKGSVKRGSALGNDIL
ncbi:MAG: DNA polymerase IV [Lachnospiraceae bacterium]|jgi:DNA polymerase-4|nr:DNA polymerase IV [Lachnospiraceae bacterium]